MENKEDKITVKLDGNDISIEQLQEKQNSSKPNEKIVEKAPGEFKTLKRLQETA
jgi:hypothetical protein